MNKKPTFAYCFCGSYKENKNGHTTYSQGAFFEICSD